MSELTTELRQMAADSARRAQPPAVADIIRSGDHLRRRRSVRRRVLGGLSAAGAAAAAATLSLTLTGSPSANGPATIRTAAFTLVSNADGTATLTINPKVLVEPRLLQTDLARDGIRAMVTVGKYCSSNPAPPGFTKFMKFPGTSADPGPLDEVVIDPAAMPAGTELSFGNFKTATGAETAFSLIDMHSYTCTSTAPTTPPSRASVLFIMQDHPS